MIFQSKEFKDLKRLWYKKLQKAGFDDIEDVESGNEFLNVWHSSKFQSKYGVQTFQAKQRYYELAFSFLENHSFESKKDKNIWELHSKGISLRKISRKTRLSVARIHKTVIYYRSLMLKTD